MVKRLLEALLWEKKTVKVFCNACLKYCNIQKGKYGYCKTRFNKNNRIYTTLVNSVAGMNVHPVEEIPLFHFMPSTNTLSLTLATKDSFENLNKEWVALQKYLPLRTRLKEIEYENVVKKAVKEKCKSITFDYIESALAIDYAYKVARTASRYLTKTVLVTNGYITHEMIRLYAKFFDGFLICVKASLDKNFYKKYDSIVKNIEEIKDNIAAIRKRFIHFEVANLIIPKIGDNAESCAELAEFLVDLNPDIPLHLIQFYPDEKFPELEPTPISTLERCAEAAKRAGLRYVYISNVPENFYINTYCYNCNEILIKRNYGMVLENNLLNSRCPSCGFRINVVE